MLPVPPIKPPGLLGGHLQTVSELAPCVSPVAFPALDVSVGQAGSGELTPPGEPSTKEGPELADKSSSFQSL